MLVEILIGVVGYLVTKYIWSSVSGQNMEDVI